MTHTHSANATPTCRNCGIELTDENWYPSDRKRHYRCKRCYILQRGGRPFDENPNCPLYFGVHVAERVLSHVFKDVERMPPTNPGYDFICNKGKKVDVKSSCIRRLGGWGFAIRRNTTPDYFLCIAFDNQEDLTPLHLWLIPGNTINHLAGVSISESTIHKWDAYRLGTSKVAVCCDSVRTARKNPPCVVTRPYAHAQNASRLSVLAYLKAGLRPVKIAAKMGIAMSTLQYHLTTMVKQGYIRKVGYGTWNVLNLPESEKTTPRGLSRVGSPKPPQPRETTARKLHPQPLTQSDLTRFQQDAIRTHAITTTWQVPRNMHNWNNKKRTEYLDSHNIPHIQLGIGGGGQRIIIKEKKVWLLNKSIIVYDSSSYFAEDALTGKNYALAKHLSIIKHIERLLHVSFKIGSDHIFKVSRQHYALMQNALAQQYNEAGEKLEIRDGKGLWFLIDNSYNLNEAETVHHSSAMTDNKKVQDLFNSQKKYPITTDFVLTAMAGIQANQEFITQSQVRFAENSASHVGLIKDLSSGVKENTSTIKMLGETVQDMAELMRQFKGAQK